MTNLKLPLIVCLVLIHSSHSTPPTPDGNARPNVEEGDEVEWAQRLGGIAQKIGASQNATIGALQNQTDKIIQLRTQHD